MLVEVPLNITKSLSATIEMVKGAAAAELIDKNPIRNAVRVVFFMSAPECSNCQISVKVLIDCDYSQ